MKINISDTGESISLTEVRESYFPEEITAIINALTTALSDAKEIKNRINEIQQLRKKYNGSGKVIEDVFDPRD